MKRLFLLSTFFALCVLCNAKINTHIFGLNLGEDTREQCVEKLEKKGYELIVMPASKGDDECILIYAGDSPDSCLMYAKIVWDYIELDFVNDVLYNIYFLSNQPPSETREYIENIEKAMEMKYSRYNQHSKEKNEVTGETIIIYSDHTTTITLDPDPKNGLLTMNYTNEKLDKKAETTEHKTIREMSEDL